MISLLDLLPVADQAAAFSVALAVTMVALIVAVATVAMLHPDRQRRREAREVLRILLNPRDGS